jgi:hypothetical protein
MIIDNSEAPFQVIAEGNTTKNIEIHNKTVFNKIVQL